MFELLMSSLDDVDDEEMMFMVTIYSLQIEMEVSAFGLSGSLILKRITVII